MMRITLGKGKRKTYFLSKEELWIFEQNTNPSLKITLLTPEDFSTSAWSGGSTTQLYISPAGASYAERNFEVRISTAKVEVEQSAFTYLPGVHRQLMILEGTITITHAARYSKSLTPYDVDTFSGDWSTTAVGTCTDFNVMTTGQHSSALYHLDVAPQGSHRFTPKPHCKTLCFYLTSDSLQLTVGKELYSLSSGYLLVMEEINASEILLNSHAGCALVVVEVY